MPALAVIGGTYLEICHFPQWHQLFGSGSRAAFAATCMCDKVGLHTCVGEADQPGLVAMADTFGVMLHAQLQPDTIVFEYFHGLSAPRTWPVLPGARGVTLNAKGSALLRFGIVEGEAVVHGDRVVYDPQSPSNPRPFAENGSTAQALSVVLNRAEGAALTGEHAPEAIAAKLLSVSGTEAVVVKQGSDGALVVTASGQTETIPVYGTNSVFPIGSGDVFSAVYAAMWASHKIDPVRSASFASLATAYYCSTRSTVIPRTEDEIRAALPELRPLGHASAVKMPRCYLAGPFFTMGQRWLVEEARMALTSQGLEVFSPFHEVGLGHANDVVPKDLAAIEGSDIVFGIVDGLDSGTLFEIGYARSRNIPVVAFAEREEGQDLKLLQGSGCRVESDFTTAVYRTNWTAYHR